jgi:hypothetical protein
MLVDGLSICFYLLACLAVAFNFFTVCVSAWCFIFAPGELPRVKQRSTKFLTEGYSHMLTDVVRMPLCASRVVPNSDGRACGMSQVWPSRDRRAACLGRSRDCTPRGRWDASF